jgi:hypothetical protein
VRATGALADEAGALTLMSQPIPIGLDDFRTLRELGLAYVDKSHLIRELLDAAGVQVALLPRPRRFGKTLNLSMLRWFFEKRDEDLSHLFADLSIWQAGAAYRAHFQRYPVIHLSFKETRFESFELCWGAICHKIQRLFAAHRYLLTSDRLGEEERRAFGAVLDGSAAETLHNSALLDLSGYLHAHHGEKVVLLLDEYDEPIHGGYANGYAPRILDRLRALLGGALKSNEHLYRGVITGILRVARESLFSGLNNVGVYTLLSPRYATCFGFTEPEVVSLLDRIGQRDHLAAVRSWYNGYLFGGEVIYNPWSVMSFLESGEPRPRGYWVATSSNDLVREALAHYALELEPVFEALLEGGSVERTLDENVVLAELTRSEGTLWALLVFSGYLKAEAAGQDAAERTLYRLSIPNREIREVYATSFRLWMEHRMSSRGGGLSRLTTALLSGDAEKLEEQLQAFVTNVLSYYDPGSVEPERVYQGFILGLLAVLEPEHLVRSNRESGAGRPDVTVRAREPGKPAVVLELKVAKKGKRTPAAALREGLAQIAERGYDAELLAAGASVVHAFAVAFDGKRAWVAAGKPAGKKTRGGGRKKAAAAGKRRGER